MIFHKKKGQTSGEYIALVAGGALFVLIVIVAVNGFFNAPAKQSVIEQGAIVQSQYGTLSGQLNVGAPITLRSPKDYQGLTAFPVQFAFQVNECLTQAELYTDDSGPYALRETKDLTGVPEGTLVTFNYQIQQEVEFTYDIVITPCEGEAVQPDGFIEGASNQQNNNAGWQDGNFHLNLNVQIAHATGATADLIEIQAVAANSQEYLDARKQDLAQGNAGGVPTAPTVTLKGETYSNKACNGGLCTYTFNFAYNLNKNAQTAQLQFFDSNDQPANIAQGNTNSIAVNAKTNGDNTFTTTVVARDPTLPGATPTLDQYKWNLQACTKPQLCAASQYTNKFDFFPSDAAFTETLGRNADGKLYLDCEQQVNGDVGNGQCTGTAHFHFDYNGANPMNGFQATLLLISQANDNIFRQVLTTPVNGVNEGDVNKDFTANVVNGNYDSWNIKICKQAQCGYAYPNGQTIKGQEPPELQNIPGGMPQMPGAGGQIPQGQPVVFSVEVTNAVDTIPRPVIGFSKDVTFNIQSNSADQFTNTAILNIPDQGAGTPTTRKVLNPTPAGQSTEAVTWASASQGEEVNVRIESCLQGECETSDRYVLIQAA